MAVTIKLRRATSTEWNSINPVLRSGEPGYETDTKKLKIGDGSTVWTNLEYLGGDGGTIIDFEAIQDNLSSFFIAGSGISFNYDDENNSLTITNTSIGGNPFDQVAISGVTNGQFLQYNSGSQLWVPSSSGNFTSLLINGSGISVTGHTHTTSDITNFNSSVSGLIPPAYDAAVPWSLNHTIADGTRYLVNDLVYVNGRLYKANYENESIAVTNTTYWTDVGPGYRLNIDGRDIPNIPYPVKNVIAGSGISVSSSNGQFTVSASGQQTGVSISNYGNNRLLTSTGTNTGINAEANFTFDGIKIRQSAGDFAIPGDSQNIVYVLRRETSSSFGNTAANLVLTTDGGVDGNLNTMRIPRNTTWTFDIKVSAFNASSGDSAWWIFRGGAKCDANGSVNFIGSIITESDSEGSMAAANARLITTSYGQDSTIYGSISVESLSVEITGVAEQNIRWSAVANISQVRWGNEYDPVVQSLDVNLIP